MMFWSDRLRVVLATVHMPLADVPGALTRDVAPAVIRLDGLLAAAVRRRRAAPRGRGAQSPRRRRRPASAARSDEVLAPAVAACRGARGSTSSGPLPADTLFVRAARGEFDAVVACYHDQGLIPVKLVAFGRAVNVTLGLPIVRTSVDHGTAFDIARKGTADESSLVEAVLLAVQLAARRPESLRA